LEPFGRPSAALPGVRGFAFEPAIAVDGHLLRPDRAGLTGRGRALPVVPAVQEPQNVALEPALVGLADRVADALVQPQRRVRDPFGVSRTIGSG